MLAAPALTDNGHPDGTRAQEEEEGRFAPAGKHTEMVKSRDYETLPLRQHIMSRC